MTEKPQKTSWESWRGNLLFLGIVVGGMAWGAKFLLSFPEPSITSPHRDLSATEIDRAVDHVDAAFEQYWESLGMVPAEESSSIAVARRLGLALTGTIPSLEEIRRFETLAPEERISRWAETLAVDPRSHDWLAERFARAFVGVDEGPFVLFRRRKFVHWLSDEIAKNVPYDQLVRKLIASEGTWMDEPAVNFLTRTAENDTSNVAPDPSLMAGRTARAFLGMRLDCLQCHDDFLGNIELVDASAPQPGQQIHFHQLAAFFSHADVVFSGVFEANEDEPYRYRLLDDDEESSIAPEVPFLRDLAIPSDHSRRDQLATWVTHKENRPFARATVNRVWATLVGQGLMEPIDDLSLAGPFPAPLEALVDEFIESGFDLRRLMRIVVSTKAFRLQSTPPSSRQSSPIVEDPSDPAYSSQTEPVELATTFPATRLRPDQIAQSIIQSTSLQTIDSSSHVLTRLTGLTQRNNFVVRYGDQGEDEFEARPETVTQRLLMLNGDMIQERLQNGVYSASSILQLSPNVKAAVETLFLITLTRRPTAAEEEHFLAQIEGAPEEDHERMIQDLHWSLINSLEFGWNH